MDGRCGSRGGRLSGCKGGGGGGGSGSSCVGALFAGVAVLVLAIVGGEGGKHDRCQWDIGQLCQVHRVRHRRHPLDKRQQPVRTLPHRVGSVAHIGERGAPTTTPAEQEATKAVRAREVGGKSVHLGCRERRGSSGRTAVHAIIASAARAVARSATRRWLLCRCARHDEHARCPRPPQSRHQRIDERGRWLGVGGAVIAVGARGEECHCKARGRPRIRLDATAPSVGSHLPGNDHVALKPSEPTWQMQPSRRTKAVELDLLDRAEAVARCHA